MFFKNKQQQINEFLTKANAALPDDNPMYFDGRFITGEVDNPEILFIGINPGHGDWENLENRKKFTKQIPFEKKPCKYIEGFDDDELLASRIVRSICGGDVSRLERCAETSFSSYFATPSVDVLRAQINQLPANLKTEHHNLMDMAIIDEVKPKHIVCIGLTTFNDFIKLQSSSKVIKVKAMPSESGLTQRIYYKKALLETSNFKINIHGLIHLSGGRPSAAMLKEIETIMNKIW